MASIFTVDMLPAREGDCLWVEFGDAARPHRMIIDGGRSIAYNTLSERFAKLPPDQRELDLLVCTHVDADHIEGLLKLVEDPNLNVSFADVWLNGFVHLKRPTGLESFGAKQGERFADGIVDRGWRWNGAFSHASVVITDEGPLPQLTLAGGMKITLLSPDWNGLEGFRSKWEDEVRAAGMVPGVTPVQSSPEGLERFGALSVQKVEELASAPFKKDGSKANETSIAFLATFGGKTVLFAGDAHADVLESSLRRLTHGAPVAADAFKLSHHGAQGTLTKELLAMLDCSTFLVSTDGSRHEHPDREAIARILVNRQGPKRIVGNYNSDSMLEWDIRTLQNHFEYTLDLPAAADDGIGHLKLI